MGLILLITLFGLFLAEEKDAIMQSAFMAVSSFASNIGAIVIVAFMEINKPENVDRSTVDRSTIDRSTLSSQNQKTNEAN
ncbi:MAG: hypothetical protein KDE33_16795 [Bacteroidetes bacterium]|nr:hypothetical protein [Bacteroidota bacterium]